MPRRSSRPVGLAVTILLLSPLLLATAVGAQQAAQEPAVAGVVRDTSGAVVPRPTVKLGAEVRRDVLLVFKEAVNNVARHSACTRVDIEFDVQGPRLSLVISDNGVGFDPLVENGGQGLVSLRRRAKRMRGVVEIISGPRQGTTVRLLAGR